MSVLFRVCTTLAFAAKRQNSVHDEGFLSLHAAKPGILQP